MLPEKRPRRSASVPGGIRSDTRIHSYLLRHRHGSGRERPASTHADVAGLIRPPVAADMRIESSGVEDLFRNSTVPRALHFSSAHSSGMFTEWPLSSVSGIRVPTAIRPLSGATTESPDESSACSPLRVPVATSEETEVGVTDMMSIQRGQRMTRCHSQPGASLTRTSNLKRHHDECRPRLDFRKMMEVVQFLPLAAVVLQCKVSRISLSVTFVDVDFSLSVWFRGAVVC